MNKIQKEKLIANLTSNLPILRTKANLTQAKLSELIGVSRQTLVAVETKKRPMSWSVFMSCLFVFQSNPETRQLLDFYDISAEKLKACFETSKENGGESSGIYFETQGRSR